MIEILLSTKAREAFNNLFGQKPDINLFSFQKTRPDFEGDFTMVVFPLLRFSGKSPEQTAEALGNYFIQNVVQVSSFNVVKGFLNLVLSKNYWMAFFEDNRNRADYGFLQPDGNPPVVVEYSSPNTNKPLHLGHIRNILLGWSVAEILEAGGKNVARVNLVNDRGIHICKTMLAWKKWANGQEPSDLNIKGDKYVGNLYVKFEQANKIEIEKLKARGMNEEEAYKASPLMQEALLMLQKWEQGDQETRKLWTKMNNWVYEGFDLTYERMGISFDKIYYESDTYLLGKEIVKEGLDKGIFYKKDDGSVWVDLSSQGLDEKLLLRPDGTSVYITQDLGTAELRYRDYHPEKLLYVVGNEQNYHFDVMKIILKMLGKEWAEGILHISYGMVELPEGKMKSREGKVVDADELMQDMYETAARTTRELGKVEGLEKTEADCLFEMIGQGALKYFMLKVDPKKNMLFNPEESIDFNGNTGPFIQYTHARIRSLLKKAAERELRPSAFNTNEISDILPKEKNILRILYDFPSVIIDAGKNYSPARIANYIYELAKEYNQFYQELPVLKEEDSMKAIFRLAVSEFTGNVIRRAMTLLGIQVPEKM